jgi:spore germination cell wall hydrolase CwlJ-like protein
MSTQLILPRIHLGGTGPTTLINDYSAAIAALQESLRLLGESYHDRDYYLLGQTVHREARGQHIERCAAIGSVVVALRKMEEHAYEAREARDKAHLALLNS